MPPSRSPSSSQHQRNDGTPHKSRGDADYAGAIFVQSRSRPRGAGPFAPLLTASGWASASQNRWGDGWVVTRDGVLSAAQAQASATSQNDEVTLGRSSRLPDVAVTLVKDIRSAARCTFGRRHPGERPWAHRRVPFVWQRHDPFDTTGIRIASELSVPLVMAVHALHVDEAAGWGVQRPVWGRWMRQYGELRLINRADLISCVSEEVASLVRDALPGRATEVVVVANGIDRARFRRDESAGAETRKRLDIPPGAFVVGWHGSFRKFHGLDDLLRAYALARPQLPEARVLLVGHGSYRARLLALAEDLGIAGEVVSPGEVLFSEVPAYLSAMDAAVTLTDTPQHFHYSPLKLREYHSCGVPVIASRAGELQALRDREEALLVDTGDKASLASAMIDLSSDSGLRQRMVERGVALVARHSWSAKLDELLAHLRERSIL